jgi:hypothetical protein
MWSDTQISKRLLEAGQIAPLIRHRDAAALMAELVRETPRILARPSR